MSSFLPKFERMITIKLKVEKEELFAQIEESFNNYRILTLLFYNIVVINKNTSINDILDGNGNLNFNNFKIIIKLKIKLVHVSFIL